MKISIIGTGNMGAALGNIFTRHGHQVCFSFARDPDKPRRVAEAVGCGAGHGTPSQAAAFGEVVVWAVPRWIADEALRQTGPLTNKIVIDCTNPMKPDNSGLAIGLDTSGAEELAAKLPDARVVKAFNTVGASVLAIHSRDFGPTPPVMFYCGDDGLAKKTVAGLIFTAGFKPVDVGPLTGARYLEPMVPLYGLLGKAGLGTDYAFALVSR